ncbi:MAG: TIGR03663 family protein [Acidobacteria bacterium]|nr:TIGR03663 family protein [Acidobacteriota bacterium]
MPTASTKQQRRKRAQASAGAKTTTTRAPERKGTTIERPAAPELTEKAWLIASAAVILVAALLRLYALELNPLHHDEGVNGFFLTTLLKQGTYHYDPSNYHGPSLYYITLPFVAVFGLKTFVIRLVPILFGLGTVWLVLRLRRYIGMIGALVAAAFIAVSPGAVYNSRYFIHESLFVFFTLGTVVAALWFYETGKERYLLLAAASAGLLFATKETHFVTAGVLVLATATAWTYVRLTQGREWIPAGGVVDAQRNVSISSVEQGKGAQSIFAPFGDAGQASLLLLSSLTLFVVINVLLYSSFFTNNKGIMDAFEAFTKWRETGTSHFHRKPFDTYVNWLWQEEAPILLLAVAGAAAALLEGFKNRFAIFAGAWAFGMLLAYSLIPYKTPWLMLNFTVPLAIIAGYGVQVLSAWCRRRMGSYLPALALAALAVAVCAYQSVVLNFKEYDNDSYPYVYSHTQRGALELVREIEHLSERAGTGRETVISLSSPDYWPLPWYFHDYPRVAFDAQVRTSYEANQTPIVVGRERDAEKLRLLLGPNYKQDGALYPLRPGVQLVLFARRDLVERPAEDFQLNKGF